MRATHTYALLPVSRAAFDEIAGKLKDAGYDHSLDHDREDKLMLIDMHGLALVPEDSK